jgi:hypothetical protein
MPGPATPGRPGPRPTPSAPKPVPTVPGAGPTGLHQTDPAQTNPAQTDPAQTEPAQPVLDGELDARIAAVEALPLADRAAAYTQLHDSLRDHLEGGDVPRTKAE